MNTTNVRPVFGQKMPSAAEIAAMSPADRNLAALMARELGGKLPVEVKRATGREISLGKADIGDDIGIDLDKLLDGRLLVQGVSGAGKSWTLRRLLEQTNDNIQQIIIDPEGEFGSLAQKFSFPVIDGARLDPAGMAIAGARLREHRISALIDISQVDRESQMQAVTALLHSMIEAPREHWHPALIAIDEAHLFAPFGAQTSVETSVRQAATVAVTDLMSRGRKRGLAGVLATQRIAKLAKSVSAEVLNFLIGLNTLDIDIRRAAETIGWDASKGFDRLPELKPGEFVASGPAFSRSPSVLRIGPVETRHIGARPEMRAPAKVDAATAAQLLDLDTLMAVSDADKAAREEAFLPNGYKAVRAFIRDEGFPLAGRIWKELVPMAPEGVTIADLTEHLDEKPESVATALSLLEHYNAIEVNDTDSGRAVRAAKPMVMPC